MKTKERGYDKRIRFGWCDDLDNDPQRISEKREDPIQHPVAVVPMPFMSAKMRAKINKHLKGIVWPDL
jgi:hypothetical protein